METENIGHLHGNFQNYYTFNGDSNRINILKNIFNDLDKDLYILDIGCNSGIFFIIFR